MVARRNYAQGKIYVMRCLLNPIVYIGSTTGRLRSREKTHLSCVKNLKMTSPFYTEIRQIGATNFRIELVKKFPCQTKDELEKEEYSTMDQWEAQGIKLYNEKRDGKHSAATKAKMAKKKIGNRHAFKCGSLYYNKGKKGNAYWQFIYRDDGATITKSYPVKKLGYFGAKHSAEDGRHRVYPQWQVDAEQRAIEELMILGL